MLHFPESGMSYRLTLLLLLSVMIGCSREQAGERLFVYTDAQGNLVTVQDRPVEPEQQPEQPVAEAAPEEPARVLDEESLEEVLAEDQELQDILEADERDRFVVYPVGDGELARVPIDLVAEREAREARGPGYEELDDALPEGGYIETVTPVSADCCLHLLDDAARLRAGQEKAFRFAASEGPSIAWGEGQKQVRILRLEDDVAAYTVTSYKRPSGYLHPFALVLDDEGVPVLLVNNLFSRRYPETWYQYGSLQGTIPRESGHRYLVLYLPYAEDATSLQGLVVESDVPLATSGELVVRGVRAGN